MIQSKLVMNRSLRVSRYYFSKNLVTRVIICSGASLCTQWEVFGMPTIWALGKILFISCSSLFVISGRLKYIEIRRTADLYSCLSKSKDISGNSLETVDGWFYDREKNKAVPIEKVIAVGKDLLKLYVPPRSHVNGLKLGPSLDRTVKAFGKEAVRQMGLLDFGVVGAG